MTPRRDLVDTMAGVERPGRVEIKLYRHETKASMPASWLLSQTGKRADCKVLPRSLCTEPSTEKLTRVGDDVSHEGIWNVEAWKLRELGWGTEDDERQGEMF